MSILAYEIDSGLLQPLEETLAEARALASSMGRKLDTSIRHENFVLKPPPADAGNILLMNPPYKKLSVDSDEHIALASGERPVRVPNLYAAFLVRAVRALTPNGVLIAITPRSFTNGPSFRFLRSELLARASFRRIHIFEARDRVFADSDVLQENLIFSMQLDSSRTNVSITTSRDATDSITTVTRRHDQVINPGDPQHFIRLLLDEEALAVAERMGAMPCTLSELGCNVSTGRVVDFRAKQELRKTSGIGTVPLVYPQNLRAGKVEWPVATRKSQALLLTAATINLLLPNEHYVLVKRFSAKEEPRRVVAALASPEAFAGASRIGYENHLNVFHTANRGLDPNLAAGLTLYLNSRFVDDYVRQFSGHTQINATDLRELRYPTREELQALGSASIELGDPPVPDAVDIAPDSAVDSDGEKIEAIA